MPRSTQVGEVVHDVGLSGSRLRGFPGLLHQREVFELIGDNPGDKQRLGSGSARLHDQILPVGEGKIGSLVVFDPEQQNGPLARMAGDRPRIASASSSLVSTSS